MSDKGVGGPSQSDQEILENAQKWDLLARVVGYNELVKTAETLGEKMYLRLARDSALAKYASLGGQFDVEQDEPVLIVQTRPPFLVLSDDDMKLMREAVAAHDERVASRKSTE
jgi:hypothetical protein